MKKVSIYLFPKSKEIENQIKKQNQNPYQHYTCKSNKSIGYVVEHLNKKYKKENINIFPKTIHFGTLNHKGWNKDEKMLLSEICKERSIELEYDIKEETNIISNDYLFTPQKKKK